VEGPLFWILFNAFILALLALDLFVLRRGPRPIRFKEAAVQSIAWIALAAGFGVLVYFWRGPQKALEFTTGYLIEESLSVDNLFVFLVLFNYFRVEPQYQRKVLSWGIIGALVMRGLFIVLGVGLVSRFHWVIYLFGVFLIYTGAKLLRSEEKEVDPERGLVLRLVRRWLPITEDFVDGHFFVQREGRRWATPLFVVLLIVETTDVLFAVDSIPAILAISKDPFIVYTSNVFAILGLRALYFALAGMLELFHYLHYGLAVILMFIGAKMLASHWYDLPTYLALIVVASVLALSVAASLVFKPKRKQAET